MNFLAHIYLSGSNDQLKIGNFIADFIKGKQYLEYSSDIQKGIILHRHIDTFTDSNSIVRKSKNRLHERYNHYDGVIIDILYDHFLAKNWSNYNHMSLKSYVDNFYEILQDNYKKLPEKTQKIVPHMIQNDWLYNYQYISGIENVLKGMNRRTNNKSMMHMAIEDLKTHYEDLNNDFITFFDQLRTFCNEKLIELDI